MKLNFNDGVSIDVDGEPRIISRDDGLYVVKRGLLIPVSNMTEANKILTKMKEKK